MKLRNLFFMLLLAGSAAEAQSIAANVNDTAAGTRVVLTKNHKGSEITVDDSVSKNGLLFFSAGYQRSQVKNKEVATYFIDLDMFHNNNKLGCIYQSAENVTLTLEDGSEIKCVQISDTECAQDSFKAAFSLGPKNASSAQNQDNFEKLKLVNIVRVKVKTSESLLDYKVNKKSGDYIKAHFALVAKTLNASIK